MKKVEKKSNPKTVKRLNIYGGQYRAAAENKEAADKLTEGVDRKTRRLSLGPVRLLKRNIRITPKAPRISK